MFDLNLNDNQRTPAFKVQITTKDKKQQDITQVISSRLISLSLTDNRGLEADTLDLELSDHDGKLALPPRNATISLFHSKNIINTVACHGNIMPLTL